MFEPLTTVSDPRRPMPAGDAEQLDAAHAALASLAGERRRLERLGLETPLQRCHVQLRYWGFVSALLEVREASRDDRSRQTWEGQR